MKSLSRHGSLHLALFAGISGGCADDRASTTPADTTGETDVSASSEASTSTDTTGTGTTAGEDALAPWYGPWYTYISGTPINTPVSWNNGGSSFGFALFDLRPGGATIHFERCLWGNLQFEYMIRVDEDGAFVMEPVGGVHEFQPHGEIERLYIVPGADCGSLVVKEVRTTGEEGDLFSSSGDGLARGELCIEQCAEDEGEQGLLSDCGTPVLWPCSG